MKQLGWIVAMGLLAIAIAGCRSRGGERGSGVAECAPGDEIRVTCGGGASCGGRCSGDPTLTICDGTLSELECTRAVSIGFDDDSCDGLCPGVTVICPTSGSVRVNPAAYSAGSTFFCEWVVTSLTGTMPP